MRTTQDLVAALKTELRAAGITYVHGGITASLARTLVERLPRVGQDFAQGHLAEQHLPDEQRTSYMLLVGKRTSRGRGCSRRSRT